MTSGVGALGVDCCIGLGIVWSAELRTLPVAGFAYFAGRLSLGPPVCLRPEFARHATSETHRSPVIVAGAGRFSRARESNGDRFFLPVMNPCSERYLRSRVHDVVWIEYAFYALHQLDLGSAEVPFNFRHSNSSYAVLAGYHPADIHGGLVDPVG